MGPEPGVASRKRVGSRALRKAKIAQGELPFRAHGGRRAGAGRPKKKGAELHLRRPSVSPHTPLHVTLRMASHVWNLRAQRCFVVIHRALVALGARVERFRVLHFSVQGNHLHLMVEASDRAVLSSAMRSFGIRLGRGLNRVMRRRGPVIGQRYHARALRTPTEVRNVLRYVLENRAHHIPSESGPDPCSSASAVARAPYRLAATGPPVAAARTWLARRVLRLDLR